MTSTFEVVKVVKPGQLHASVSMSCGAVTAKSCRFEVAAAGALCVTVRLMLTVAVEGMAVLEGTRLIGVNHWPDEKSFERIPV